MIKRKLQLFGGSIEGLGDAVNPRDAVNLKQVNSLVDLKLTDGKGKLKVNTLEVVSGGISGGFIVDNSPFTATVTAQFYDGVYTYAFGGMSDSLISSNYLRIYRNSSSTYIKNSTGFFLFQSGSNGIIKFNSNKTTEFLGGVIANISNITSNTSVDQSKEYLDVDASSSAVTITLPSSPSTGQLYTITKNDSSANAVTVDGNGKTINGSTSHTLSSQYDKVRIIYTGTEWRVV